MPVSNLRNLRDRLQRSGLVEERRFRPRRAQLVEPAGLVVLTQPSAATKRIVTTSARC